MIDYILFSFDFYINPISYYDLRIFISILLIPIIMVLINKVYKVKNASDIFSSNTIKVTFNYLICIFILLGIIFRCNNLWYKLQASSVSEMNMINSIYIIFVSFNSLALLLIGLLVIKYVINIVNKL